MQIIIDDLLTNYQIFGKKGANILILPGWKRNSIEWQSCAQELSDKNRVILLDLPGFGITQKPKDSWDIFKYSDFVKDFLTKVQIKNPIILGHSFGGRIGIIMASQSFPIDQLVLVDAAGIEKKNMWLKFKVVMAKILKPIIPKSIISNLLKGDYAESGEMKEIFKKVISQDLVNLLPKIKVPTTIIWGEQDKILPLSHAKILHDKIQNSRLRIVWGAAHDPHLEKFEQFIEILSEILNPKS